MSIIYKQERNHDNWTGRVSSQSRITGTWAHQARPVDTIPPIAYLIGLAALAALFLAAYL